MKTKVQQKIEELENKILKIYGSKTNVKVRYNLNSSRAVGRYIITENCIELNPGLLNEYKEIYIEDTVVHEYAHAVVQKFHPSTIFKRVMPHGKEFKSICRMFGNPGKAGTSLFNDSETMKKLTKKKTKRWSYVCSCKGDASKHIVSTTIHNRIQRGYVYACRSCGGKLVRL